MTTLESRWHPGGTSFALVWGSALLRPLAATMLVVMLGALTRALLEEDPLDLVVWAAPLAVLVAMGWTALTLRRRPAELVADPATGRADIRSVWDVVRGAPLHLRPVWAARRDRGEWLVPIGTQVTVLRPEDWSDPHAVESLLNEASLAATALP